MDYNIKDVSGRLKSTREYLDISVGEMANKTNVTTDEYISLENGEKDSLPCVAGRYKRTFPCLQGHR